MLVCYSHPFVHPGLENDWGDDAIHLEDRDDRDGVCDFDGDGIDGWFLATGVTWWYASGGKTYWTYRREAPEWLDQVGLGDFDGDGRCDVCAVNRATRQWQIATGGSGAWTALPGTYDLPFEALRFGNFSGDRLMDIFYRAPEGQWWAISPGVYPWRPLGRVLEGHRGLGAPEPCAAGPGRGPADWGYGRRSPRD